MSRFYLPERGIGLFVGIIAYAVAGFGLYLFARWLKPYAESSTPGQDAWLVATFGETGSSFLIIGGIVLFWIIMILVLVRNAKRARRGQRRNS